MYYVHHCKINTAPEFKIIIEGTKTQSILTDAI